MIEEMRKKFVDLGMTEEEIELIEKVAYLSPEKRAEFEERFLPRIVLALTIRRYQQQ